MQSRFLRKVCGNGRITRNSCGQDAHSTAADLVIVLTPSNITTAGTLPLIERLYPDVRIENGEIFQIGSSEATVVILVVR